MLCIVLLCLFIPSLPGQTPAIPAGGQSVDALIKEALSAYQTGQMEVAVEKLRLAYRIAPSNPHARLYLGLLLYQNDSSSLEARSLMESVLDQFPANPDLLLRLADSYLSSQKEAKLASLLELSKKTRAANHRLALNIIYLLVRYAQLGTARRELDAFSAILESLSAAKTEPAQKTSADATLTRELGEVSFIRGLIAATSGQKDEALRFFQEADKQEFPPRDSAQMRMLAEALFRLEEYGLSAQAYHVYLAHFPRDHDARLGQAISYSSYSSYARAREQLQQVVEQAPSTPQANYYLGLVLLELKNNDEARQYFEVELKNNPGSYQAMVQLAFLAYLQGDDERCRQWLEKAGALNADWVEMHYIYGLLYNRQGKYDQAIESLENAVSQAPKHIKAHYQLSIACLRAGNEGKANEHREIYERLMEAHKAKSLADDARKK